MRNSFHEAFAVLRPPQLERPSQRLLSLTMPGPPVAVAPPTMVITEPARWTVAPGDNLWTIAERHLGAFAATEAELPDVGDYWRQVVLANQDVIRSSDPDLIYPGEVVVLPPVAVEQP